jgi:hypothetical protein
LISFLNSKTDPDFAIFSFKIPSEPEEVPMDKVVHLFEVFKTIFYLKFFELRKYLFRSNGV